VKLVVQVRLLPSPKQAAALGATLRACNAAACRVSEVAFERKVFRNFALRKLVYGELKVAGLGAQAAQHVIKKTCDAYATLHGNIRAGRLGPARSARRVKAEGKPVVFREDAAQPYDDRMLSWQYDAGTVSIWTVAGRAKDLAFTGRPNSSSSCGSTGGASRIWYTGTECGFCTRSATYPRRSRAGSRPGGWAWTWAS